MIYLYNGERIAGQFVHNDSTYPNGWLEASTEEERAEIGIVTLTEVYPSVPIGYQYDGSYEDDLIALTRTYNYVEISSRIEGDIIA